MSKNCKARFKEIFKLEKQKELKINCAQYTKRTTNFE
jgi:hypothetical protein